MWFSYTVSQPLVLELRPHLLVDDNLLQLLQRRMLTHLVLKGQEVLTYRACVSEHMHRHETTVSLVSLTCFDWSHMVGASPSGMVQLGWNSVSSVWWVPECGSCGCLLYLLCPRNCRFSLLYLPYFCFVLIGRRIILLKLLTCIKTVSQQKNYRFWNNNVSLTTYSLYQSTSWALFNLYKMIDGENALKERKWRSRTVASSVSLPVKTGSGA